MAHTILHRTVLQRLHRLRAPDSGATTKRSRHIPTDTLYGDTSSVNLAPFCASTVGFPGKSDLCVPSYRSYLGMEKSTLQFLINACFLTSVVVAVPAQSWLSRGWEYDPIRSSSQCTSIFCLPQSLGCTHFDNDYLRLRLPHVDTFRHYE